MKRLNPTIPLGEFRLAVNLSATKAIQNQPDSPAYQCNCDVCYCWRNQYSTLLTPDLLQQMQRIGIAIDSPFDAYQTALEQDGQLCRVMFYMVGKCISGPLTSITQEEGVLDNYQQLRLNPWLALRVYKVAKEAIDCYQLSQHSKHGDLLCVDLRLQMP